VIQLLLGVHNRNPLTVCLRVLSCVTQADRVAGVLERAAATRSLLPSFLTVGGEPSDSSPVTLGAFGDVYYEYLLKVRELWKCCSLQDAHVEGRRAMCAKCDAHRLCLCEPGLSLINAATSASFESMFAFRPRFVVARSSPCSALAAH
jgi:hypothetical protein